MSTKIYNAYIWNGTVEELMSFLKDVRKAYIEEASEHLIQFSSYLKHQEEEYKKDGKYFSLSSYIRSCISAGLNEPDNIEASIAVYFHRDKIAIQCFGLELFYRDGHRPLAKMVSDHPQTEEYEFWNNVDQPEELSEEAWDDRKDFWDFLQVPCEDGLIYELSSRDTVWQIISNYNQAIK